jgi:hypothetical protein
MTVQMKARRRHTAKVSLIEFLRPGGNCPYPYSIEMAFQTLRYLIASGVGYKTRHHWLTTSISSLLGGSSDDCSYPRPIAGLKDLLQRFQVALFARGSAEIDNWRRDKGIHAYAELDLAFLHYKPMAPVQHLGFRSEAAIVKALHALLEESPGETTSISLNSIHPTARVVHQVDVTISPEGFRFSLRYGFHTPEKMREQGDSEWVYCLAETEHGAESKNKQGEPFLDTFRRALDRYAFIMDPRNAHLTTTLSDDAFVAKENVPELV